MTSPADISLLPAADTSRLLHEGLDLDMYGNNNVNQWWVALECQPLMAIRHQGPFCVPECCSGITCSHEAH